MRADPQSYDGLADHYEQIANLGGDPIGEWLPAVLPAAGQTALDIGCGTGRHVVQLAGRFDKVVGVDLSAHMVELARTLRPRANVEYRIGDLFDVEGHFDFVFSSAMLHHVRSLDAALAHIRRLVRPSGRLVLADVQAPSRASYRLALKIAPRVFFRLGAIRGLITGLGRRAARERYRMATFGPWLDHLASDRFPTRQQFDAAYGSAFPEAIFVDVAFFRVCIWDAPAA